MTKLIKKRDGSLVEFQADKITEAIRLAGERTGEFDADEAQLLTQDVVTILDENIDGELTVENVQDSVELALLNSEHKATAKSYILYREQRSRERKPDIFKRRLNLKPYEYPQLTAYKEAIQQAYWLHTHFNYTSDVQDYRSVISEEERNIIKNAMLAISQVEVAVKNFWGDIHHRLPKPEIGAVGATFSFNEVVHHDAYSHLLELLGLNGEFERINEIPALSQRVGYLTKSMAYLRTGDDKDFTMALILFSLFIEHVSLFSQFLIIMSFNKHRNLFRGMSNVVEATSKEEQIHGLFGIDLISIIKEENPEWFDYNFEQQVIDACRESYEAEERVIDWIYENGDLDFMPKKVVKEFVKRRMNESLLNIGYEAIFEIDEVLVAESDWFTEELLTTKVTDFFDKKPTTYTRGVNSITADDLF